MLKRSLATPCALVLCFCISAATQAAGNYSQNFATTPAGWINVVGAWNVTGGEYRNVENTASPATASYYDGNSWTTNYTLKVKAYSEWAGVGNQVGLVFGLTNGGSNYYAALVNMSGTVTINQISGSSNTTIATGSVVPADVGLAEDSFFDLEIFVNTHKDQQTGVVSGSDVTVSVQGKIAIAKFQLASAAGKIGVIARADKGHFKNLTVTDNLATRIFRGTFDSLDPQHDAVLVQFDSSTCSPSPETAAPHSCWGYIRGTDASGDTWPFWLWGGFARLQYNSKTVNPDVKLFVDASLESVTGHAGTLTNALYLQLKGYEAGHSPQMLYNLQPDSSTPQHDLYMRYWVKIPNDSHLSNWHSPFQAKTYDDYRIIFYVRTGDADGCTTNNTPHWYIAGDDAAGTKTPITPFWHACNLSAVPFGTWFKLEMFMHRSPTGTGRFWVAIDGHQIFDVRDPDGLFNPNSATKEPLNRIMLPQLYGGDEYPKYQYADDMEVWDGFPSDASPH